MLIKTDSYNFRRLGRRFSALHRDLKTLGNGGFVGEGAETPPAANKVVNKAVGNAVRRARVGAAQRLRAKDC